MDQKVKARSFNNDEGFSLLETLIALAIMSLTSLILFQSTTTMMSVSEKAATASERVVENTMSRKAFNMIVRGLTPDWEGEDAAQFKADSSHFSGLSNNIPSKENNKLTFFTVRIENAEQPEYIDLRIMADGQNTVLESFNASDAFFQYLGEDQKWYDVWPPENIPSTGFFNDITFMQKPNLPLAVRLWCRDPSENITDIQWVSFVENSGELPFKQEKIFGL